jgi:hypothetical protein
MHKGLVSQTRQLAQQMRVKIAGKQHGLEKENACRPYRGSPAQKRQHHLSDHGLTAEQKKRAEKKCKGK